MKIRSLPVFAFAAWVSSFATAALADVPNPTTSAASGGTTTGAGAGGSAAAEDDPGCTVAAQEVAGTNCKQCDPSGSPCGDQLDSTFNFACRQSAKAEVWCDGPPHTAVDSRNYACSAGGPAAPWSDVAAGALLAGAALLIRRRRRA